MAKKHIVDLARMIAKMADGGLVDKDEYSDDDEVMDLQEKGEYKPEELGGSEELAAALRDQMESMADGGLVLPEHSSDVEPGEPETVPSRTPESLGSSDLTEAARVALMDKKKRRRMGMGRV